MKIKRSTKCSTSFLTHNKMCQINHILNEYSKTTNYFIDLFWNSNLDKKDLKKDLLESCPSWFSQRMKQCSAREAIDMIHSSKEVLESNKETIQDNIESIFAKIQKLKQVDSKINRRKINFLYCKVKKLKMKLSMMQPKKPRHSGKKMNLSSQIISFEENKNSKSFDAWIYFSSIGNKIKFRIPIKFHRHYLDLQSKGIRLNSYVVNKNYIQFCFDIETGPKKEVKKLIGIDSGINALASTSEGKQFGKDIKEIIQKINRCKHGSKRQKRLRIYLKNRISEVAKEVIKDNDLVVIEKLSNLNKNSKLKGRLSKNIRSVIGSWGYRYWLERLQFACEANRISFRSVNSYYTSQKCSQCGHINKMNRFGEKFKCQNCDHFGNADINAALNILERFITGKYGFCYQALFKGSLGNKLQDIS